MQGSRGAVPMSYVFLVAFASFALTPVITILLTSVAPRLGESGGIHLENFVRAWTVGGFGRSLGNSVVVAAIVVGLATVLSIGAGYAFGTMRFRGSTVLFYLFLVGMMIPAEATVIPLFFDLRTLGLTDTYLAIAMPQVAQSIAFGTFWLRAQFRATPTSLVEAAAIDGARPLQALVRILVPASKPAIVTMVVLVFMWTWNEFLIALVMTPSGRLRTAPLGLANCPGQSP